MFDEASIDAKNKLKLNFSQNNCVINRTDSGGGMRRTAEYDILKLLDFIFVSIQFRIVCYNPFEVIEAWCMYWLWMMIKTPAD